MAATMTLAQELETALYGRRNPLAWLLVAKDKEGAYLGKGWDIRLVYPIVDEDCNPIRWESASSYQKARYAMLMDHQAVMVNPRLDFNLDIMEKEPHYGAMADAIMAARANDKYKVLWMMNRMQEPAKLWHFGRDEIPEKGRNVLWQLENKVHSYRQRNEWYSIDVFCQPFDEFEEEGEEQTWLRVEEDGDVIVKGWSYLPDLEKGMDKPEGWEDEEDQSVYPSDDRWYVVIKEHNGRLYYDMDRWTSKDGWECYKINHKSKVRFYAVPEIAAGKW